MCWNFVGRLVGLVRPRPRLLFPGAFLGLSSEAKFGSQVEAQPTGPLGRLTRSWCASRRASQTEATAAESSLRRSSEASSASVLGSSLVPPNTFGSPPFPAADIKTHRISNESHSPISTSKDKPNLANEASSFSNQGCRLQEYSCLVDLASTNPQEPKR